MLKEILGNLASSLPLITGAYARSAPERKSSPQVETREFAELPKNRVHYDYSLKCLLLIAGVSGSGKSTFIQELIRKKLPSEITSTLPPDVHSWSVVHAREPHWFTRLFRRQRAWVRGQILHQDVTDAFKPKRIGDAWGPTLFSISEDELLMRRLAAAEQIHVVIVATPARQLIRQLSNRSILLHVPSPLRRAAAPIAPLLQRLEEALPEWVKSNASKQLGQRWRHRSDIRERNDHLNALYSESGSLKRIYQHWMITFLDQFRGRVVGPILYVEPIVDSGAHGKFRLVREPTDL
jgi:adenylate kinase family enzyme